MIGKTKLIIIAAILVVLILCIIIISLLFVNDQYFTGNIEDQGEIIGNPDYEDSLYISYHEFKEKFEQKIKVYKYNITEDVKKKEYLYHIQNDMVLRTGLQSDNDTLSFIIFKWSADNMKNGINICRILYRIFNSEATEVEINNHLIQREVIDGEMEIDLDDFDMYLPNEPVRFEYEKKDGYIKLYINDEAMGY